MGLRIIGEHPFAKDRRGQRRSRIATLFPHAGTLVTLPGIHATQRLAYLDALNQERADQGLPKLTRQAEEAETIHSVDLIVERAAILIRPDPNNMPLAFRADEVLQQIVPKHKVKFLYVWNEKVRDAIKRRGECWRITPLPRSVLEMKGMIATSRIAIHGEEIYYYNRAVGTRFLTYDQFARLAALDDADLQRHLAEIREFSARINPRGKPEVAFFMANRSFSEADFAGYDFHALQPQQLRAAYQDLRAKFERSVPHQFREDDLDDIEWRNRMFAALIGWPDEVVSEETLLGLSSEFFMQIQWLPGGRIEEGELIFDSIFEQGYDAGGGQEAGQPYDDKSLGFIYNSVREYGDLEYVNVGRVVQSLSQRPKAAGRRDVYIAELKLRDSDQEIVNIIRMQKWGVREHLDEGKDLLGAILESEEYTEYVLDRRLGCRQLGMNLPKRFTAKKISERYDGRQEQYRGTPIWSTYFERDYIRGIATDKIPRHRFADDRFALEFARLLGGAAASNMIVGRCDMNGHVLFDDGDEVVLESQEGMPVEIVVADQTGTFADYERECRCVAAEYAEPINRRAGWVSQPCRFADAYLDAFCRSFLSIQQEYRNRRRAFDGLVRHRKQEEAGSFAYRWEKVLRRLDRTGPLEIADLIRQHLQVY